MLGIEPPRTGKQCAAARWEIHTSLVGDHGYEPYLVAIASPSMPSSRGSGERSLRREWLAEPEFKECLWSVADTDFEKNVLEWGREPHPHPIASPSRQTVSHLSSVV